LTVEITSAWALVVATALDVISLGCLPVFFPPSQAFSLGSEGSAPLGEPPSILFGPVLEIAGQAEMFGGVESPERIEQHLAREEDEVCTTVLQDLLSKVRGSDHPDRARRDIGFMTDLLGKRYLVTWSARKVGIGRSGTQIPTRRTIDEIDTQLFQFTGEDNAVLDLPAAIDPVRG
jgi:hypothetical protein